MRWRTFDVTRGSVYGALGYEDAAEMLVRAELVSKIADIIARKGLKPRRPSYSATQPLCNSTLMSSTSPGAKCDNAPTGFARLPIVACAVKSSGQTTRVTKPWHLLFAAGMLAVSPVWSCGACVEDRIAATYDHELVVQAMDRGHQIVFTDVTSRPMTRAEWHLLSSTIQTIRGVMKGSVRISKSPMALSFQIDPKATTAATAVREINRRVGRRPVKVALIHTMAPPEIASQ